MTKKQTGLFEKLVEIDKDLVRVGTEYWKKYSYIDTWQFWVILGMLILPLIVLFFTIDRKKIFLLGFYGLNVNVWFGYANVAFMYLGLINYPYYVIPPFPSISFEGSLIPVFAMLVYQWTLNHHKNYYLYTLLLAAFFAFIIQPIAAGIHLIEINPNITFFEIFLIYLIVFLFSKAITSLFLYLQKKRKGSELPNK
ncbi:hypothetical protein MUB24_14460 [Lederbergia sp. NSJ-179]|uniref:hypothetical protein n=1 Tax=Lederbergia sp. NSJ-179 TaxID=2931402 RepID=UPI001FD2628E|nr:hypothetical protein [Lederbergia sp. NSJ-179]MCJ7842084.1 hypothetical protein [Lederbergia sp. NSJ-179]